MKTLEPAGIQLRFIPLQALLVHEEDDPYRVERLIRALQRDGKLRNPPVVSEFGDKYVVLDGATRTSALRGLGYRHILVQVVDYETEAVKLSAWYHVIVGMSPNRLLANLAGLDGLTLQTVDSMTARRLLVRREIIGCITMRNGQEFAVICPGDINRQANFLCKLVAVYRGKAEVYRTTEIDLEILIHQYPDLSAVIAFPNFDPGEVIQVAINGDRLPMGITRHLISGRALGLDIPLSMLSSEQSLEEKNVWLAAQIRLRLRTNKIRLYQEPVFVFDD